MREISSPSAAFSSSLSKFWLYRNADMERKKQNKKTRTSKSSKSDDCPDVTNFRWVFLSFSCAPFENATCCVTTRTDDDDESRWQEFGAVLCAHITWRTQQRLGAHDGPSGHHHLPSSSRSFTRQVHIAVQSREKNIENMIIKGPRM